MPQVLTGADAEAAFAAAGGAAEAVVTTQAKANLVDQMDAEAAALREQHGQGPQSLTMEQRPEGGEPGAKILGKFKTVDDLAAAYTQLEKRLGAPKAEPAATEAPAEEADAGGEAPAEGDPTPSLSADEQEALTSTLIEAAGGEKEFQRLAAWAKVDGDPLTVGAFNQALQQGNAELATLTLKALRYDYLQDRGYEPELLGGRAGDSGLQPFKSEAELKAAMRDPRYYGRGQDPAYVREVEARMALSPVFNIR